MTDDAGTPPAQPDLGWLGLERRAGDRWSFELTGPLSRLDGKFFGGTGLAVATALMEARTDRAGLWATVQFTGTASVGEHIDCDVEVLAHGRRSSQLRVSAWTGERLVFSALGATGDPRGTALEFQISEMPAVGGPDDAGDFRFNLPVGVGATESGWLAHAELRHVEGLGRGTAIWARMRTMRQTRATLGFLADVVPVGVVRAAGRAGAGTSLDNAIRLGPDPDTDWVLLDLDPYLASRGYVHGAARVWSEDGRLLAVASQTASLLLFD